MRSFLRAVRMALKYKYSVAAAMACSLMVGILWGTNIGTLYPFIEVVFRGQSIQESLENKLTQAEKKSREVQATIDKLRDQVKEAPPDKRESLEGKIELQESMLTAEKKAAAQARKLQPTADKYLPNDPFLTLVVVVGAFAVGTFLKSMFLVGSMVLVAWVAQRVVFDLQNRFYRRTLQLDVATFDEDRASGLLTRFTHDIKILTGALTAVFGQAVREPLKMAACLAGAAFISWRLLLLSLLVTPIGIVMLRYLTKSIRRATRRSMDLMSEIYQRLSESFYGIVAVKAFTMEAHERDRFRDTTLDLLRKRQRVCVYLALVKPIAEIMAVGIISVAVLGGAFLVLHRETHLLGIKISDQPLTPTALMVFFGFLAGVADPARKLSGIYGTIFVGTVAAQRIFSLMDREPKVTDPSDPQPVPLPHRELAFENIAFWYRQSEPVLEGIDLSIRFGERIALVGPNGCGKSTLAKLVPRFYDPQSGAVRLDGVDLRQFRIQDVRQQISLVTQDPWMFDDTVANNIRYGNLDASDDEVVEAARKAHAHSFVEELEDGYETIVGQRGNRLSGGQRQRIALARAILRDPAILILDEATSEIDLESEQLIHRVLAEFTRGRTTIMITHRLSTLNLADRIVVMERGKILDAGSHQELAGRCEAYQRLHLTQLRESA